MYLKTKGMSIHQERWDSIPRSLNTKILKTDDFVPFDARQNQVVISWFTLELLLSSSFLFRYKSKTISDGSSKKINGAEISSRRKQPISSIESWYFYFFSFFFFTFFVKKLNSISLHVYNFFTYKKMIISKYK